MLSLFSINAKDLTPLFLLGIVGIAAYFGWKYLSQQQANAPALAAAGVENQALQFAQLQAMFGGSVGGSNGVTANNAQGTANAAGNTSATVGTQPAGSV